MAASDLIFGQALSFVQLFKSTTPLDVYTVLFVTLPTPSCLDTCMYPRIYVATHYSTSPLLSAWGVSSAVDTRRIQPRAQAKKQHTNPTLHQCMPYSASVTKTPSGKPTSDMFMRRDIDCALSKVLTSPFISTDFCRLALVPVSSRVAASDLISAYPTSCLRMVSAAVRRSCHGCAFSVQVPRSGHIWKLELISYPACHRLVLRGHMSSSVGRYGSCRALNEPIVREFTDALCE
ncbi:hypothetical protein B0H10DRAFT_661513 [Mycena sp. CBHHK59/15]|nr:hypothetical protein B0H10DRAFT_661513 [Mycena sp. CBHHK59/15]